jgi:hypothetical protein
MLSLRAHRPVVDFERGVRNSSPDDPTFRMTLQPVFRSFRQIPPDRIGERGGRLAELKQNEWHARDWLCFSWSGTNAAWVSAKEATAREQTKRGDVQMLASI